MQVWPEKSKTSFLPFLAAKKFIAHTFKHMPRAQFLNAPNNVLYQNQSQLKCPNNTDFPSAKRHDPLNQHDIQ